ncbi:MAG: sulfotransferase [Dehalococcoidia bacterium]|nr:sulfotransferase [Dehalococcoidia bacterium]
MKPIFLFSLPRSGSTLTQRILAAHPEISTVSEPWILLPLRYMHRETGVYAEYNHDRAAHAIADVIAQLPYGKADFDKAVRQFVEGLYNDLKGPESTTYFLDKTPRYDLIVEDIFQVFPDAKFIFLWRNPLAVAASLIDSWGSGKWNLYEYTDQLYNAPRRLVEAFQSHAGNSLSLRYEDLVQNPLDEIHRICDYLALPYDDKMASDFTAVQLNGRMGDTIGTRKYEAISQEPLNKWQETMGSKIRSNWCRNYIRQIGPEVMTGMGYDSNDMLATVDSLSQSTARLGSDIARMSLGKHLWMLRAWYLIKGHNSSAARRLASAFRNRLAAAERAAVRTEAVTQAPEKAGRH